MEYNSREFEGISDFKNELDSHYSYQLRPCWIPAASQGAEFWITVFINSDVTKFLASAVASGFIWDLINVGTKKYILTPLFESLEKLYENNEPTWGGLRVLKLKFQFDNCEIFIGGLNRNFTSVLSSVFSEVSRKKPKFETQIGQKIIKIELPIQKNNRKNFDEKHRYTIDVYNEDYTVKRFKELWKVTFQTNFPVMIYDFDKDSLVEI